MSMKREAAGLQPQQSVTKRILLISANHHQASHIQVALLRFGLTVEVASTFRRGLAVSQHRPPLAIVLDGALPDLDATQLHDRLKANHLTAAIPIVMLAQGDATDAALRAIELGGARSARRRWPIEERVIEELRAHAIL